MRTIRVRLELVLFLGLTIGGTVAAGAPAGEDAKSQARVLAQQAIDDLNRGEDLTDKDERLAVYQRGLDLAQRAVKLDDENSDAHFAVFGNRGRILMLQGVGANPISLLQVNGDLERALELNPNHADALTAKGGLYRQLPWVLGGSLTVAEKCLTKAIALDPDAVSARIELAETYRDMGQPKRGLPLLQMAASIAERKGKRRQLGEARALMQQLQQP
jgi:tetratricopeptide (TPR) repeat protein